MRQAGRCAAGLSSSCQQRAGAPTTDKTPIPRQRPGREENSKTSQQGFGWTPAMLHSSAGRQGGRGGRLSTRWHGDVKQLARARRGRKPSFIPSFSLKGWLAIFVESGGFICWRFVSLNQVFVPVIVFPKISQPLRISNIWSHHLLQHGPWTGLTRPHSSGPWLNYTSGCGLF